jgi:nitrate reductase NapE component
MDPQQPYSPPPPPDNPTQNPVGQQYSVPIPNNQTRPETAMPFDGSPQQAQAAPASNPSKSHWVKWLVFWLVSWPLGVVIELLARLLHLHAPAITIVNIISILLGMYGFIGWIPMVISIVRGHKK